MNQKTVKKIKKGIGILKKQLVGEKNGDDKRLYKYFKKYYNSLSKLDKFLFKKQLPVSEKELKK